MVKERFIRRSEIPISPVHEADVSRIPSPKSRNDLGVSGSIFLHIKISPFLYILMIG